MTLLPQGIPSLADYGRLVASPELAEMERYSSAFRARHGELVSGDPLEQWSRRWEYPFAYEAVREHVGRVERGSYRILDAGSGFTFFPFLLSERLPVSVTCADARPMPQEAFDRAAGEGRRVEFSLGDFTSPSALQLRAPFDSIVCISVLEHVQARHRETVLRELHRLLRPGGLLVLTFDVAVDSDYEIPLRHAESLLTSLGRTFPNESVPGRGALGEMVRTDVLTSRRVAAREPGRMPWRGPLAATLGSLRHGFLPRSYGYRNLTVWCGRLVRDDAREATGSG